MELGRRLLAGIGCGLLLGLVAALVLPHGNPPKVDAVWPIRFEYWMLLGVVPPLLLIALASDWAPTASGLLFGFTSILWLGYGEGPVGCGNNSLPACVGRTPNDWFAVTTAFFGLAALLFVVAWRQMPPTSSRSGGGHRPTGLSSGPALISELERKLGVSVVVHSVDESVPVRIHALLRYGSQSREVTAIGPSKADAWRELARMATAWRNANENLVPLWGGGL
jgi:hypothetical protein